jgi:hypothetical protein
LAGGLLGALVLIVAEFTTLYSVDVAGRYVVAIQTEAAGAHNAYAMVPLGALAALLALVAYRTESRAALVAVGALGVVAVLIAMVGDLPDAHAHGLTRHYQQARNSPGPGLYLETLGAVLLIFTGGLGLAALGSGRAERIPRPGSAARPPGRRRRS